MIGDTDSLELKTGLSLEYAQKILVRDISCKEALLDLIDNSIDSARSAILNSGGEVDSKGMPKSYEGYEIKLGLDKKKQSIYVEDNSLGIDPSVMKERLLVIGEESNEPLAIGHFGVGLKRALLKLGKTYSIKTSYAGKVYSIKCSSEDFTENFKKVIAKRLKKKAFTTYTKIHITDVSDDAKREMFRSGLWKDEVSKEIGVRYSIFLKKGLTIKYIDRSVVAYCPDLRSYKSIVIQEDVIGDAPGNIKIHIRAGLHEGYQFPEENTKNTAKQNQKLTEEYGWYYVCNDRVIKIATRDKNFGWASKWHPEYNGFVGWIYFAGNVKDLPWNTKKTDIDPSSEVFSAAKGHLKKYASKYRTQNRGLRKNRDVAAKVDAERIASQSGDEDKDGHRDFDLGGKDHQSEGCFSKQNNGADHVHSSDDKQSGENLKSNANGKYKAETKIKKSSAIVEKLESIEARKLCQLYNSLCLISLVEHPVLAYVGSWSFFEAMAKLMGASANTSFVAFFGGKIHEWYSSDKGEKSKFKKILSDISERGNLDKHDATYHSVDARQLAVDFSEAENFILKVLNEIFSKKNRE